MPPRCLSKFIDKAWRWWQPSLAACFLHLLPQDILSCNTEISLGFRFGLPNSSPWRCVPYSSTNGQEHGYGTGCILVNRGLNHEHCQAGFLSSISGHAAGFPLVPSWPCHLQTGLLLTLHGPTFETHLEALNSAAWILTAWKPHKQQIFDLCFMSCTGYQLSIGSCSKFWWLPLRLTLNSLGPPLLVYSLKNFMFCW